MPVRIIEHVIMAKRCGVCGRRHIPKLDLSQEVIGTHRVGVRLMSLVACLHISGRIPIRTIQKFLSMVYGLHISTGELVEILHAVADADGDEPQRVLAQRIEKFLEELFMFVEYPEVPSENNSAERAIRPAVVARKISGGTRSDNRLCDEDDPNEPVWDLGGARRKPIGDLPEDARHQCAGLTASRNSLPHILNCFGLTSFEA